MAEVFQRVPRYSLLLKEYLSCLPPDSTDVDDVTQALEMVDRAAVHVNDRIARNVSFDNHMTGLPERKILLLFKGHFLKAVFMAGNTQL